MWWDGERVVHRVLFEEIEDAQAIMLIGCNPRAEAPVLNARIRKAWLMGAEVGPKAYAETYV